MAWTARDYVLLDEPLMGVEPLLIDAITAEIEVAAADGVGVLVTDHYHQDVAPLVKKAYVIRLKQYYYLDGEGSIDQQIEQPGYLGSKSSSASLSSRSIYRYSVALCAQSVSNC